MDQLLESFDFYNFHLTASEQTQFILMYVTYILWNVTVFVQQMNDVYKCGNMITKKFCVLHNTFEHNYISPSSTVGIQLHVSALYVGHLQVVN
jgi:hypothetical protein